MDVKGENQKLSVSVPSSARRRSRDSSAEKRSTSFRLPGTERPPKLSLKFKQLIDDYTKLYKDHQELVKENTRLQNGIARYFKEHLQDPKDNKKAKTETKEEKERNAGEAEEEHQRRYEGGFRNVKELNRKIVTTKEEAQLRSDKMKSAAAAKEVDVQAAWRKFQEKLIQFAKTAVDRDNQPLSPSTVTEHLERIDSRLKDWRVVGLKGALIANRKHHLEEQLRALDNFGGDMSLNRYDELKAMSRLHQERNDESLKDLETARIKQAHSSQVVAHLSEKVFYLHILRNELKGKLDWLEKHLEHQRATLNRSKAARDTLRRAGQEIREKTGIMFTPILLHDLEWKIKLRNQLIRKLNHTNKLFTDAVEHATKALPVDAATHMRNMARGDLVLLPEIVDTDEAMDVICNYAGQK